jgi:NAD(P)-dependent dehydrogenase (short-subunit alcohol dehydrogenase family)
MDAGKGVVITGAADGMGRAAAERLAGNRWKVLAVDIAADKLGWTENTANVSAFVADVTSVADNQAMAVVAAERLGRVDAAIFNAGVSRPGAIDRVPLEEWRRVVEINLFGPVMGIRALLPALRRQGGGAIVVTSSLMGLGADPENSAYAASKHGVIGLVRSLARELGEDNIRVNALCPGLTETGMTAKLKQVQPENYARLAGQVPLGRWAQADEMASVMEFLISPAASYVSGHAMVVDAGTLVGTGLLPPSARMAPE